MQIRLAYMYDTMCTMTRLFLDLSLLYLSLPAAVFFHLKYPYFIYFYLDTKNQNQVLQFHSVPLDRAVVLSKAKAFFPLTRHSLRK